MRRAKASDHAGDLRQADYFFVGQVGHVGSADDGQQVVFAHAVELDVGHHHHLVVLDVEEGVVEELHGVDGIAEQQLVVHAGDAVGGVPEAVAGGVLADAVENVHNGVGHLDLARGLEDRSVLEVGCHLVADAIHGTSLESGYLARRRSSAQSGDWQQGSACVTARSTLETFQTVCRRCQQPQGHGSRVGELPPGGYPLPSPPPTRGREQKAIVSKNTVLRQRSIACS